MKEILLTIIVFAAAMGLLWLGLLRAGKTGAVHGHGGGESGGSGCRFCGSEGVGLCAKESAETKAMFQETLASPCECPATKK